MKILLCACLAINVACPCITCITPLPILAALETFTLFDKRGPYSTDAEKVTVNFAYYIILNISFLTVKK